MALYNRGIVRTYENRVESQYFPGGSNESFWHCYGYTYIEADFDHEEFDKYVKSNKDSFVSNFEPIGSDGISIRCYRFNNIHPSQNESATNCKESAEWYRHHISNGYYRVSYHIEDSEYSKIRITKRYVTAYDTKHRRIYCFRDADLLEEK